MSAAEDGPTVLVLPSPEGWWLLDIGTWSASAETFPSRCDAWAALDADAVSWRGVVRSTGAALIGRLWLT